MIDGSLLTLTITSAMASKGRWAGIKGGPTIKSVNGGMIVQPAAGAAWGCESMELLRSLIRGTSQAYM